MASIGPSQRPNLGPDWPGQTGEAAGVSGF